MNEFYLVDYKGKFDIICDELDEDWDYEVGKISKEEAINQAKERKPLALYYGVTAYIGKDKELNNIYK